MSTDEMKADYLIIEEQFFLKFFLKTIGKIFKINKYTCRNVEFITGDLLNHKKGSSLRKDLTN